MMSLLYYHFKGKYHGMMGIHVDDFKFGGTKVLEERVIKQICEVITIGRRKHTTDIPVNGHLPREE